MQIRKVICDHDGEDKLKATISNVHRDRASFRSSDLHAADEKLRGSFRYSRSRPRSRASVPQSCPAGPAASPDGCRGPRSQPGWQIISTMAATEGRSKTSSWRAVFVSIYCETKFQPFELAIARHHAVIGEHVSCFVESPGDIVEKDMVGRSIKV